MPKFQQFLLLAISFVSLFVFAGCQSSANVANTTNTELKGISYESFTADTTFADIIKAYGNPDVENAFCGCFTNETCLLRKSKFVLCSCQS